MNKRIAKKKYKKAVEIIYLKDYLQKYDGVSEQIYNSFSKEITEIEEELRRLCANDSL